MNLTELQAARYAQDGFVLIENLFTPTEVETMKHASNAMLSGEDPRRILSRNSAVRSVYDVHNTLPIFSNLTTDGRVLKPALQLLHGPAYVLQSHVNPKIAFDGVQWDWHIDYLIFHLKDHLPAPNLLNAVVYLDEMNQFNGPLLFVPGSHKEDPLSFVEHFDESDPYPAYSIPKIRKCIERYGIVSPLGPSGSVLFFDVRLLHCSLPNLTPWDRSVLFIRYNQLDNQPSRFDESRPEWRVSRQAVGLKPVRS